MVLAGFLALCSVLPQDLILGDFLVLTILVNGTHFMASYFLLYSSREYIRRYRTAIASFAVGSLALVTLRRRLGIRLPTSILVPFLTGW